MPEFIVGGKKLTLRPADVVGSGGEADIYRKGGRAYKIFKPPAHKDFVGLPDEQRYARERIIVHQRKLPAFPRTLPPRVMSPGELVLDAQGDIAGYEMRFVEGAEVLFLYCDQNSRDRGVSDDLVRDVMLDLHRTIVPAHAAGFVFADFNDLNVLVKGREAFVIDADSGQFGPFFSPMFTQTFVDPTLCAKHPAGAMLTLVKPHSADSDWYAYLVMLMRALLFVGPYGGVYRPKDPKKRLAHDLRPLSRITVFDPEVVYPKHARHFKILPDDLLDRFEKAFTKDARGMPPAALVESLRFTTCASCGAVHARAVCPNCVGVTPAAVKEIHTGSVHGVKIFEADGPILYATLERGTLRYLYHEGGAYFREGGARVTGGPLDPNLRYRISGSRTIFGKGGQALVLGGTAQESLSVDSYGLLPLIDANADGIFFVRNGALERAGALGVAYPDRIGDVLANQTLFWVGDTLGFGFYRAAELANFFVFRSAHRGINDSVALPPIRGQLVDSTCCFAQMRVWFFTATQEGGRTINRCFLLDERGSVLAHAEATAGDGSWLGRLRGACAAQGFLLVPTDDGVVRIAQNGAALEVVKEYPDTHRFVDASSHLFLAREGLYVTRRHDIWRLTIGSPQPAAHGHTRS